MVGNTAGKFLHHAKFHKLHLVKIVIFKISADPETKFKDYSQILLSPESEDYHQIWGIRLV